MTLNYARVTGRGECVQESSTRTFENSDLAMVWLHNCEQSAIGAGNSESRFSRAGRGSQSAAGAQIPARATTRGEFGSVGVERDAVGHVCTAAEVRDAFTGFSFPNNCVCTETSSGDAFSIVA